jgi:fumarylacetoacetate (FAA) hydrolase family protein
MAAVGHAAAVGLHPISRWNNPEPEVVLAVAPSGAVVGASLGNDVNLRDVEGRSALLLGRAKDNNASAAIGPFVRLFDEAWGIADVRRLDLTLKVEGRPAPEGDGFVLHSRSSMAEISREPLDLVAQAMGRHHQYPDGMMLYLGTLFAPTQDRPGADGEAGQGFTHRLGDRVTINAPGLGALANTVASATEAPPW